MIVSPLLPTRLHASRAIPAAPAPADSSPTEQVELSATPPPNPWPALAAAGALQGAGVGGAVGAVLQGPVRQDLLAVLQRLEKSGVEFHERRSRFVLSDTYPVVTSHEALATLEQNGENLYVACDGGDLRNVKLQDLKVLDCERGAGPAILEPTERETYEVGKGLEGAGFKFRYSYYSGQNSLGASVARLSRGEEIRFDQGDRSFTASSPAELAAADLLLGSGRRSSLLERPEEAERLRQAEKAGFRFLKDEEEISAYEVFTGPAKELGVRLGEGIAIPLQPADLSDLQSLGKRLRELDDISERPLAPAYQRLGGAPTYFVALDPRISLEAGAAVMGELARAVRSADQVEPLARRLVESASDEFDLAQKTVAVARVQRSSGHEEALRCADEMVRLKRTRLQSPRQAQEAQLYTRIARATGSHSGSVQAFDLVRVPLGQETQEDRVTSFLRLAATRPAQRADEAVDLYRALMAERAPGEPLASCENRLRKLISAVPPDQTLSVPLEAFAFLQAGLRDQQYSQQRADEMADEFARHLVLHQDPEAALSAMAGHSTSASALEERADSVLVGGVRIRRKPREQT